MGGLVVTWSRPRGQGWRISEPWAVSAQITSTSIVMTTSAQIG
jgi:hypothetical protein